ncbi:MAG: hypothetical protein HN929_04585 [Chloroflexi bacterium]|jgi:hypothetical protein|nr:hypothetical protein [Chloroflexota bacterium]MBT7080732.1 hypothetical protein [Chloroflexota bacterium]MBT7290875.1 hypothetical protein [Chloroflexota bacterium]
MPKKSRKVTGTYSLKSKKKAVPDRSNLVNLYSGQHEEDHVAHAAGAARDYDKVDESSYRYVGQDLRKMGMLIGVMVVILIVLTIVLN